MKNQFLFVFLSILFGGLISCDKNKNEPDPNRTEADIFGTLSLFDEFNEPLGNEGMIVSIEGSDPLVSDTSDSDGNYRLKNLPFATYNLLYQKEGYGTFNPSINHINNVEGFTEIAPLFLGEKSNTKVPQLTLDLGATSVTINVTVDSSGTSERPRYYRIFYSTDNMVSSLNYEVTSARLTATAEVNSITLSVGKLHEMGFITGDIVYVKAYGESFYPNEFFKFDLGFVVFPNLNPISATEKSFEVQ